MARKFQKLSDATIEALRDFSVEGQFWDTMVRGLLLRVGKRKFSWAFHKEHRTHGRRGVTFKTLGEWPGMNVADARREASIIAGRVAERKIEPGKRKALKFGEALDDYLKFLRAKSAKKGKPARHAANVEKLRRQFFGEWEKWPLSDLANNPLMVREWHERVTREAGPVSANRAAEVLRACYRFARKLNRALPPDLPTSGIVFNAETPSEAALPFKDFPKWAHALEKIESPTHRAYHLFSLLTGMRPGEAARLRWPDVRPRERILMVGGAKADNDIPVPLSVPIVQALKVARDAADEGEPLIFPGCAQVGHRDKLPARGMMLRHSYRTVAADVGVDEMLSHFLMGHAPEGISQRYVARMILNAAPAMREAQRKISARIMELLAMTPLSPSPPLSPSMQPRRALNPAQ